MSGASESEIAANERETAAFRDRLATLQGLLEKNIPGYEELLRVIHRNLAADENLLHMLSDEEIGTIIGGLAKRKNIVIAESVTKGGGKAKKAPKTLEDFM